MKKIHFKKIPKNAKLLGLGNHFRQNNIDSLWKVATHFIKDDDVAYSNNFDIEANCIFAIGRKFVQEEDNLYDSMTFSQRFVLPSVDLWEEKQLKDCPRLSRKLSQISEVAHQQCFYFETGGMKIWLPKFELARKLFFHAGFISRAAYVPNGLDVITRVVQNDEDKNFLIEAMPKSGIAAHYFRSAAYREFFSWLLLNREIKTSFESIWQCMNKDQYLEKNYWRWLFNFIPPKILAGAVMNAVGPFDPDNKELLVWEIKKLSNLACAVINDVEFSHPSIRKPVKGTGEGSGGGNRSINTDGTDVDTEEDTKDCDDFTMLELPSEGISYTNTPQTIIKYSGTKGSKGSTKDENNPEPSEPKALGTQEGIDGGNLPQGDFEQLDPDESIASQESKFNNFIKLIDNISNKNEITYLGKKIGKLPKVKGCSLHWSNKKLAIPRLYLLAKFKNSEGRVRYVLELDNSDGRSIITKVLAFRCGVNIEDAIEIILQHAVKKSLCWCNAVIKNYCDFNQGVTHPDSKNGFYVGDFMSSWERRILKVLVG